jgi:hypothetical protein
VVRFEGNVVMDLDNLGASDQPESAAAAPEPAPVHPAKARSSSAKTGNPK